MIDELNDEDYKNRKYWGHNEDEVIELIDNYFKKSNCLIYAFNLPFDFSYIMTKLLLKYGLENTEILCKTQLSTIYNVQIKYYDHILLFRDLHLLLGPGTLEQQAKAFNCPHLKLHFDEYTKDRHCEGIYEPTDDELLYCYHDVACLYEIVEYYYKLMEGDDFYYGKHFFDSYTAASYSAKLAVESTYATFLTEDLIVKKDIKHKGEGGHQKNKDNQISRKAGDILVKKGRIAPKSYTMKNFRKDYPLLTDENEVLLNRSAYHGGLCYPFYKY